MQIRRRSPSTVINISILQYRSAIEGSAPNNILEEIVWQKETEVEQMREKLPLRELQTQALSAPPTRDFAAALRQGKTHPALIAEVKKASPSKGVFRDNFDPVAIAKSYQAGGATCLSVLTDVKFFQGSFENLSLVRSAVDLPLLCKDFIIYPYQMYWARIHGADAILLIAAILNDQDLQYFLKIANKLKMAALIEVHNLEELDRVLTLEGVSLVGINNRNLEDFSVDLQTTCQLMTARGEQLQAKNILVVSESGLHYPHDLSVVKTAGVSAVLIGESLVKQPDPQLAITNLFS
ncbi:indole-3-glycerol phosphate synthase TrpC [Aphanizomenon flos-aquae NRERC-008]|jgi:indole-3-glycerol phosphate synthase|uniref:Indole-3-glycerol phosphate synthase n=1 Tax=Aphanizomenon flos-aquae FACHB-1249 TaxID=2692889 RepID=A0ABR8ISU2_APHFL|nr:MULTISPECIES: indole-3-glycerol phosphate synthase TrpC [Aphanizomenon]MCE2904045.1 indole-3-glycerol phosphate synthase TrpC [Anabaena sp. CoA2_C59]MDJ0504876.1 indole-3-glycerol phosphate synthase TrpC [Nostocales cyanobacterium LE14-WE12]OBQ24064.1 MAG: indole-3-glycerol phosphate synthase [Anabaena sp. WA113]MBD2390419.1 indole-3-glycerol phosphate synthase TrpC [Aphanizomenon flos-aquae FACHB-1171]MBD2557100.1 indole-3-glycerol phosphate synthase TrpC [Aphanizomenon flos-aquae FACHB-12